MITQTIILAGGGDTPQSIKVDYLFHSLLKNKKFLFIPHAVAPEIWSYEEAINWVKLPEIYSDLDVTMKIDLLNLEFDELLEYDGIYLMGGNTFKLLKTLKETKFDKKIINYLEKGKIVLGLSAGAIIFGENISTAEVGPEKDENLVNLKDWSGLNLLNGALVVTHYISDMNDELLAISNNQNRKIICIPESSGVIVNNNQCRVIGADDIVLIDKYTLKNYKESEEFEL